MEFLEITMMLYAAFLIYKKPEQEKLAVTLIMAAFVLLMILRLMARSHVLPYINV